MQQQQSHRKKRKKRKPKEGSDSRDASSQSSGEEAADEQSNAANHKGRLSNASTGTSNEEITINEPLDLEVESGPTEAQHSAFVHEQVGQKFCRFTCSSNQ